MGLLHVGHLAPIHGILDRFPETLDQTWEHTSLRIDKVKRQFAHQLFELR